MKSSSRIWQPLALAAALGLFGAHTLQAQVCTGNPRNGGVAYVNGKGTGSTSNGGAASFTPGSVAIGLGARVIDSPPNETGFEGGVRFSIVFGERLQVCPTLGLGFDRRTWDVDASASLTTNQLVARGGVAVGYDIAINDDFSVAPFVAAEFVERVTYFQTKVTNSVSTNTGVNAGAPEATYGLMLRWKHLFAGMSANHAFKKAPPNDRRLYVGWAF